LVNRQIVGAIESLSFEAIGQRAYGAVFRSDNSRSNRNPPSAARICAFACDKIALLVEHQPVRAPAGLAEDFGLAGFWIVAPDRIADVRKENRPVGRQSGSFGE